MQELAELAGTSQQQIDRLEKGQRRLTAEWMEKLSLALSCKPTELIDFTLEEKAPAPKVETALAKVIGAIETKFSNLIRKFPDDEQYEISFKPGKKDAGKKFFALIIEGGMFKNYPENSELIFALNKSTNPAAYLSENGKNFIAPGAADNFYKFQIGSEIIEAQLVKSLRSE